MLDLRQLTTIDIKQLSEEEADRWCQKLLNYNPVSDETGSNLINLFQFTRSLLQVKQIQTDVLIEELQHFENKLENVGKDFDELIGMAVEQKQKQNKKEKKKKSTEEDSEDSEEDSDENQQKESKKEISKLQEELSERNHQLELERKRAEKLKVTLKQRDRELDSLHREMITQKNVEHHIKPKRTSNNEDDDEIRDISGFGKEDSAEKFEEDNGDSNEQIREMRIKLNEKNLQIEQLLDKLYDSDRISLDLAEQVAKFRLEQAKLGNDLRIAESKCEMLTGQLDELRKLNQTLIDERNRRQQLEIEARKQSTIDGADSGDFEQQPNINGQRYIGELDQEIKKLNILLEVKDNEISDLRGLISERIASSSLEKEQILQQKRSEIEQLEQELEIVANRNLDLRKQPERKSGQNNSIQEQQLKKRVEKLKRDKLSLLKKIDDLEREAKSKDQELELLRHRTSFLNKGGAVGGAPVAVELAEENAVLSRMIRYRDGRINFLIDQLNRNQLIGLDRDSGYIGEPEPEVRKKKKKIPLSKEEDSENNSSMLTRCSIQEEIPLMDQLIALEVERDILAKQLDGLRSHLEKVNSENRELQLGMKEILDGIRQGDQNNDLVIECPSLERVCLLLENRFICGGSGTKETGTKSSNDIDFTKFILLKSELDFVRGQNEQLRAELKQVRGDFLSVIDEYTSDILQNWTIPPTITYQEQGSSDTIRNDDNTTTFTSQDEHSSKTMVKDQSNVEDSSLSMTTITTTIETGSQTILPMEDGGESLLWSSKASESTQTEDEAEDDEVIDDVLDQTNQSEVPISDIIKTTSGTKHRKIISMKNSKKKKSRKSRKLSPKIIVAELIDSSTQTAGGFEKVEDNNRPQYSHRSTQTTTMFSMSDVKNLEISKDFDEKSPKSPKTETISTQTDHFRKVSVGVLVNFGYQDDPKECPNCSKYLQMLTTVRQLIGKEREQIRLNEDKLLQQIELTKNNLKLVHKEYQLDIEAKNEEIKDLRNKLLLSVSSAMSVRGTSSSSTGIAQKDPVHSASQAKSSLINGHGINLNNQSTNDNLDHQQQLIIEAMANFPEVSQDQLAVNSDSGSSKPILDSIVTCLQKCLKQKDETLAEYRQLIDEMRDNYFRTIHQQQQQQQDSSSGLPDIKLVHKQDTEPSGSSSGSIPASTAVDAIYNELFVKPCVKENEELIVLLRNAFHQLKIIQTESKRKIESLQAEANQNHLLAMELKTNLESTSKELEHSNRLLRMSEAKEKMYQDKVDSLTGRITELTQRQASSAASLNNYRKKVQNEVFQESADLRVKVAELTVQIRKAEVDRWTAEKKLAHERQQNRDKLLQQEELVVQLTEQNTKLQTIMAKLEKRLFQQQQAINKKSSINIASSAITRSTQTEIGDRPRSNLKVRFPENPVKSSRTYDVGDEEEEQSDVEVYQDEQQSDDLERKKEKKQPNSATTTVSNNHQQLQFDDNRNSINQIDDPDRRTNKQQQKNVTVVGLLESDKDEDNHNDGLKVDKDRMIAELQLLLEKCYRRDRMESALEEITTVAGQVIKMAIVADGPRDDDRRLMGQQPPLLSCEQVYEQLIDMQFERLVSENAQLKVQLKIYQIINNQQKQQ